MPATMVCTAVCHRPYPHRPRQAPTVLASASSPRQLRQCTTPAQLQAFLQKNASKLRPSELVLSASKAVRMVDQSAQARRNLLPLLDRAYARAASSAGRFESRQIATCMWSLARLGLQQHKQLVKDWLALLAADGGAVLQGCCVADLAKLAYAATKLPEANDCTFLDRVGVAARQQIEQLQLANGSAEGTGSRSSWEDLCFLLSSFATLRHYHAGLLQASHKAMQERLAGLPDHALVQLTWALAELDSLESRFADSLAEVVQQRAVALKPSDAACCARSLAMSPTPGVKQCLHALFQVLNRCSSGDMDTRALHQALQAHALLHSHISAGPLPEDPELPYLADHLREQAVASWQLNMQQTCYSSFHHDVLQRISGMGAEVATEVQTECGLFSIDIVAQLGGRTYAIEVDGPSHFFANEVSKPTGSTLMRNQALLIRGWRVVSVQHSQWNSMGCSEDKDTYLAWLLSANQPQDTMH